MKARIKRCGERARPGFEGLVLCDLSFVDGLDLDAPREFRVLFDGWLQGELMADWGDGIWCLPPGHERVWG